MSWVEFGLVWFGLGPSLEGGTYVQDTTMFETRMKLHPREVGVGVSLSNLSYFILFGQNHLLQKIFFFLPDIKKKLLVINCSFMVGIGRKYTKPS